MIEIEVKAKLDSFDDARQNMAKLGVWLENSESQRDVMYSKDDFLDVEHRPKEGSIMTRVRQMGRKTVVCFKEVNKNNAGFEANFEAPDLETAKNFLEKIGLKEAFKIEKSRETYGYKNFKVGLDMVKELGKFIEIERVVSKPEEEEKAMKECRELLNFLVPGAKVEEKNYGELMQDVINKKDALNS